MLVAYILGFMSGVIAYLVTLAIADYINTLRLQSQLKDKRVKFYHDQLQGAVFNYKQAIENSEVKS